MRDEQNAFYKHTDLYIVYYYAMPIYTNEIPTVIYECKHYLLRVFSSKFMYAQFRQRNTESK